MNVEERPLVFDCEGSPLIGMVHVPERPGAVGILTVAAGGIQYRAGAGRQLVTLARRLAAEGTPVMRFDQRGHGDSGGILLGFRNMGEDIRCAIEVFRENVPEMNHVVLYGGCGAASGIMISAWQCPDVKSIMLANVHVGQEPLREAAKRKHFQRRMLDAEFWNKLFSGQYNLLAYAEDLFSYVKKKVVGALSLSETSNSPSPSRNAGDDGTSASLEERMLDGFQRFEGHVLFLSSEESLVSDEFDMLVASSKVWQEAHSRPSVSRQYFPKANQTFSTAVARKNLFQAASDWVARMSSL